MTASDPDFEIHVGGFEDVMPDMSDEEYDALKRSIQLNGFDETTPIVVDETGQILDGHHRFNACRELDIEPPYIIAEDPTPEQAYRSNLARRELDGGEKRSVVKQYLEAHYNGERTQSEVAADLGVSQATVSRAWKDFQPNTFTREEKRQQAKGYYDDNPDASSREIAESVEADVSHTAVTNWKKEWENPEPAGSTQTAESSVSQRPGLEGAETVEEPAEANADHEETEPDSVEADSEPEPEPELNPFQRGGIDDTRVTELEAEVEQLQSLLQEDEMLFRRFVRSYENQDVEGIENAVESAKDRIPRIEELVA